MTTADAGRFAHGQYGDLSGVVFSGPPVVGGRPDRLAVSDRFINPLFSAVLDRSVEDAAAALPRVVAEWLEITGWAGASGARAVSPADARDLAAALARIAEPDVAPHVAGATADACVRCAAVIVAFVLGRIDRGLPLYVEAD